MKKVGWVRQKWHIYTTPRNTHAHFISLYSIFHQFSEQFVKSTFPACASYKYLLIINYYILLL
uniref:Ovule protein n=1 Tax=Heterorhabditis bacteriophora TaxID=37862 RepID=A0A1I7WQR1_HETBA